MLIIGALLLLCYTALPGVAGTKRMNGVPPVRIYDFQPHYGSLEVRSCYGLDSMYCELELALAAHT